MYKICKTEASTQRQRQLELALQKKMLQCRFEDISVSDLCDSLQVPRKSFYRYFSGKDGALFALIDHTMMAFYEGETGAEAKTPLGDLERFFLFWYHHRELLEALQHSQLSGLLVERATLLAQREKMIPRKLLNLPVDVQAMAMTFAVCGLLSMVFQWHKQGYLVSPKEMSQIATAMLTQPLISPADA